MNKVCSMIRLLYIPEKYYIDNIKLTRSILSGRTMLKVYGSDIETSHQEIICDSMAKYTTIIKEDDEEIKKNKEYVKNKIKKTRGIFRNNEMGKTGVIEKDLSYLNIFGN